MAEDKQKLKEEEKQFYEEVVAEREQEKEARDRFKKDAMSSVTSERTSYKEKLNE
jgi:hypothetical protein